MPTTLIIVAAVAILIILLATASYKVCPADRVMVITGPGGRRFVSGGSAFIIPFIMRVDWLSLGAVQSLLRTDTPIPTKDAILIDVNAVANFQIASETMTVDENGKQVKALENAAKNYLNQSKERMEKDVTQVLLGKLREVIGRTELKALMENRDTFAATVAESARVDMERLGLQLTTFNIQDFTDRQNVIANMGAEMAAEISRNAKLASINAEQDVAVRQNQLDLKRAELQSISDKAQAEADAVKGITAAEQSKTLKVKEQEAEIAAAEKKAVLEQKNAEIEEQKTERDHPQEGRRRQIRRRTAGRRADVHDPQACGCGTVPTSAGGSGHPIHRRRGRTRDRSQRQGRGFRRTGEGCGRSRGNPRPRPSLQCDEQHVHPRPTVHSDSPRHGSSRRRTAHQG